MRQRWPLFLLGSLGQALLWRALATRPECLVVDGKCVWQVDQVHSPYFAVDAVFGAVGLVIGLVVAWRLRRSLPDGMGGQIRLAIFGLLASYLASRLGPLGMTVTELGNNRALDVLQLRSIGFIAAWPLATQFYLVWHRR